MDYSNTSDGDCTITLRSVIKTEKAPRGGASNLMSVRNGHNVVPVRDEGQTANVHKIVHSSGG